MQHKTTAPRSAQPRTPDVTNSQDLAEQHGITIRPGLTAVELRRPAWCDTEDKWQGYRAAIEAALPEVIQTAVARAEGAAMTGFRVDHSWP